MFSFRDFSIFGYRTQVSDFEATLKLIQSGQASCHLSLDLNNNFSYRESLESLLSALSSGKAPTHLTLIGLEILDTGKIAAMLSSGNAPENLTLIFKGSIDDFYTNYFANALNSGLCPKGLTLDFSKCDVPYNCLILFPFYITMQGGKYPENFKLKIKSYLALKKSYMGFIERMIASPTLLPGFKLYLEGSSLGSNTTDQLIQLIKNQNPYTNNGFRLFIGSLNDKDQQLLSGLSKKHLIYKMLLILLGTNHSDSNLSSLNLDILSNIANKLTSTWPSIECIKAVFEDEKCDHKQLVNTTSVAVDAFEYTNTQYTYKK